MSLIPYIYGEKLFMTAQFGREPKIETFIFVKIKNSAASKTHLAMKLSQTGCC